MWYLSIYTPYVKCTSTLVCVSSSRVILSHYPPDTVASTQF
nr:MAG TPA: hypothetical protein [Caudoviricetes sp.]